MANVADQLVFGRSDTKHSDDIRCLWLSKIFPVA